MILAAHNWPTNGDLIADVAKLYIAPDALVLDVTYGKGKWWTKYRPRHFLAHDLALDGVDFRELPHEPLTFDVVAFDPPYVAKGGRDTSGIADFDDRYGLKDCPRTPAELQEYINLGMTEAWRVSRHGGIILQKCKDYISSGELWHGVWLAKQHGFGLGLRLEDEFIHVTSPGPQPTRNRDGSERRQVHARRNCSHLLVWRRL